MDDALGTATENQDHADAGLRDGMPLAAHQTPRADAAPYAGAGSELSRREVLVGAGGTGLLAAVGAGTLRSPVASAASRMASSGDGTPEQVHLTWGNDPATSVVVSWASPGRALRPRVVLDRGSGGREVIPAHPRSYTDGLNGETVWTYHAVVEGLRPDTEYPYVVTADNLRNGATPVRGSVRTAPAGRVPFRFTSFGDLATPNTQWVLSYGQSAYAVKAVESFQPLFHLLNGDLCYADLNPAVQPEVWRDFGNNNQASAAFRPWMPCPGNHEIEFGHGPQGFTSYLTRYLLPTTGCPGSGGTGTPSRSDRPCSSRSTPTTWCTRTPARWCPARPR
jgi:hypothetical protein